MQSDGPWRTFVFRLAGIFVALIILVTGGSFGFWLVEGWSAADAAWMTVITIAAVGYQEVRPLSDAGRLLATVLLAGGITLMGVWFALLTSALIEMDLRQAFRIRRNMKKIERLTSHVIVCGGGRTGLQIANELKAAGVPYLIIDRDAERAEQLRRLDDEVLVLVADSTKDETLVQGRIGVARSGSLPEPGHGQLVRLPQRPGSSAESDDRGEGLRRADDTETLRRRGRPRGESQRHRWDTDGRHDSASPGRQFSRCRCPG